MVGEGSGFIWSLIGGRALTHVSCGGRGFLGVCLLDVFTDPLMVTFVHAYF